MEPGSCGRETRRRIENAALGLGAVPSRTMGYAFEMEPPGPPGSYGLDIHRMNIVREILREVGAATEPGFEQALRMEGFEPSAESVSMKKFRSNDNWLVTPSECRFIATRLRRGIAERVPQELLLFYDDAPPASEVVSWLEAFASFNERAAEHGGYRVR